MLRSISTITVVVVLVLLAAAPTPAQQTGDPYSINNLVALGIIPRPTTADEARIVNQIIADQLAQVGRFAGGAPSGIPSKFVNAAQQQMALFSIKWAYRERTDPGFYMSAEYLHDKQLVMQGCFPTCPPDDGSNGRAAGGNARAVLDQLRALQANDLSGVMSPRRITAAAGEQEARQLKYEIPKVIDFTKPDGTLQPSDIPAIDLTSPDIFPRWDDVRDIDFTGDKQPAPCLTLSGCVDALAKAAGLDPDATAGSDLLPPRSDGDTLPQPPQPSDPDIQSASRNLGEDIKDGWQALKDKAAAKVREVQEASTETGHEIAEHIPEFLAGKLDVNSKYTGSLAQKIADAGAEPVENQKGVSGFLTDFVTTKVADWVNKKIDALVDKAIGPDDVNRKLEIGFRKDLLLKYVLPGEAVKWMDRMFGIVQDAENEGERQPTR